MPVPLVPGEAPRPPLMLRIGLTMMITGMGLVSGCYLLNPTGGFDLIFDNLPLFGNLDEAGATAMLLFCLSYWGFDVTRFGAALGAWNQGRRLALPPASGEAGRKAP